MDAETLEHMGILGAEGAQTPAHIFGGCAKDTETFDTASKVRLKHDEPTQAKLVS